MNEEKHQNEVVPDDSTPTDWFLQSLVDSVNQGHLVTSVTLQVSGFLVSGQLISGRVYFTEFSQVFASGYTDPVDQEFHKNAFDSYGDIYNSDAEKVRNPPAFIHLRNARFYHPGGSAIPANQGVLWRGRISQVDGFNLGMLSAG